MKYVKKIDEFEIAEGIEAEGYEDRMCQGAYMSVDVTAKLHVTDSEERLEIIRAGYYVSDEDGGELDCDDFSDPNEVLKYISEQDLINLVEDKGHAE